MGSYSGNSLKSIIGLLFILISILSTIFINEIVGIVLVVIALIIGLTNLKEKIFISFVIIMGSVVLIIYFGLMLITGTKIFGNNTSNARIIVSNYAKEIQNSYYLAILNGKAEDQNTLDSLIIENYNKDVTCEKKILALNGQIELENCTIKGYRGTYNYKNGVVE